MSDHTPLIVIEVILVFGGALGFAWWQFREIRRDREIAAQKRRAEAERAGDGGDSRP